MTAPHFITLEGGEGAGKSTQGRRLAARLTQQGHKVTLTREPGGSAGAEAIRALLVTGETTRWSPLAETLLLFAARQDHLAQTIRPALERGEWVVCDRFIDSTYAYQGAAQGLAPDVITELARLVIADTMPALTLILDLPVDVGLARATRPSTIHGEESRYERMGTPFHEKLRRTFLEIAKANAERCVIIDATANEDEVARQIWHSVASHLPA